MGRKEKQFLLGLARNEEPGFWERLRFYQATTFCRLALIYELRPNWSPLVPDLVTMGMRCLEAKSPAQQNEIKLTMQKCGDVSNRYLFIRARQYDIARFARERQAQQNSHNDEE